MAVADIFIHSLNLVQMPNSNPKVEPTTESGNSTKPLVSRHLLERDKAWVQGFAAACAITLKNHDCQTIVEDTFRCNFMNVAAMRRYGVDEYDIEALIPIVTEIERKRSLNGG